MSVRAGFAPLAASGAGPSFGTVGDTRGENGGVRLRAGAGSGACSGTTGGDATCGGLGGGAACGALGVGASCRRGTGGGHAAGALEVGTVAAGVGLARTGRAPMGVAALAGAAAANGVDADGRSSPQFTAAPTGINPPQTEQRARIDTLVIFAGSSRKTERHSGQETFIGIAGWEASAVPCEAAPA